MASIIEGYSYDIFISYRQKDNKHDGWVTEFVDNLKGELESTFKEEVSVYFDINPHDGLLETHDVDESLKEKLKCLVFIPIISRTYCDTKSFAWIHEFKTFIEQASKDPYGLKVKLRGGNVANRVLPVQIHDLDAEDKKLIENELGGHIRGIEFIYKEPGVNRPLTPKDSEDKNSNNRNYRNQINKVSNALKDVITAIKQFGPQHEEVSKEAKIQSLAPRKNHKTTVIAGLVIALGLIILGFLFVPKIFKPSEKIEKSIAVLPFINESPVDSNKHFINGVMEEVLNNLMKIRDLRVLSRTSTDQYKGPDRPTIPEIARKLNVNYIVEGSGQKYGNTFILRVQLINARGKEAHIWANSYKQELKEVRDYIEIPGQIAQTIARELKTILTTEEKLLIKKVPTSNLTAYYLYLKANDFQKDYEKTRNMSSYQIAGNLYKAAFDIDTAFAKAYTGLARLYYNRYYWESYFKEDFLDSCLVLTKIAIFLDNQLDEAYFINGEYYRASGFIEKALDNYDKALKLNPNYFLAYYQKGYLLTAVIKDYVKGLDNFHKALSLSSGNERPDLLRVLGYKYQEVGFIDVAKKYYQEAFDLDSNKADYYGNLASIEFSLENFEESLTLSKKRNDIDSTAGIGLMSYEVVSGYNEEAYKEAKKLDKYYKTSGVLNLYASHRIGYFFWLAGNKENIKTYFDQQIKYCEESIKLKRNIAQWGAAHYDMAMSYAFLGDKVKAYQYLDEIDKLNFYPLWWISYAKHNPFFKSIINEERYQKLVQNMEAKHKAEHERVRKWLEENNML